MDRHLSPSDRMSFEELRKLFERYLATGGFPRPVTAEAASGQIPTHVYEIYRDAVLGDVSKLGRRFGVMPQVRWIRLLFQRSAGDRLRCLSSRAAGGSHRGQISRPDLPRGLAPPGTQRRWNPPLESDPGPSGRSGHRHPSSLCAGSFVSSMRKACERIALSASLEQWVRMDAIHETSTQQKMEAASPTLAH